MNLLLGAIVHEPELTGLEPVHRVAVVVGDGNRRCNFSNFSYEARFLDGRLCFAGGARRCVPRREKEQE